MFDLQGIPFVPGAARARLEPGPAENATAILVLGQQDLPVDGPPPPGLIVAGGAPFSHPLLRLRSLGVPVVLVEPNVASRLPYGETVLLDGATGMISTDPARPLATEPLAPSPGVPLATADGARVELSASVGSAAAAATARTKGAAAIGLVRSEYLFPSSGEQPDGHFLHAALESVCMAARPLPVTVRLLDIAADKRPPWVKTFPGLTGVLGLQGARLYDTEPVRRVFHAELDALAALAGSCELSALIPYLTHLEELERWRRVIRTRLPETVRIGAMLETPAAALAISSWLATADFVALGCNDLMQCLFAADRDQPALRHLLDPYAPTLYRFLRQVAREAGGSGGSILVCGLLSQLPGTLPLLLGLGYRRFSVDPVMIPWLAETVRTTRLQGAVDQASAACGARHSAKVRELLGVPRA